MALETSTRVLHNCWLCSIASHCLSRGPALSHYPKDCRQVSYRLSVDVRSSRGVHLSATHCSESEGILRMCPGYLHILFLRDCHCCRLCQRHEPTELVHSFLFCFYVYFCHVALSTVFYSINSPDNSPFSHSVLPVSSLPYWSFQLYVSL